MSIGQRHGGHEDIEEIYVEPGDARPAVDAYATNGWLIAFGMIAALALAGFIGWAIGADGDEIVVDDTGVTLAAVAADPEAYLGETVTIRGEVREVVSPVLFVAGSDDAEASLLVHSTELPADVVAGAIVEITGEVATVDDEFLGDFGPFETAETDIDVGTVVLLDASVLFDAET